jgi:hypothetical protein
MAISIEPGFSRLGAANTSDFPPVQGRSGIHCSVLSGRGSNWQITDSIERKRLPLVEPEVSFSNGSAQYGIKLVNVHLLLNPIRGESHE